MYDLSKEATVLSASLPFMFAAKSLAVAKQMNDHGPLHAQRVYANAAQLARLLSLTGPERALLSAAALLHDIGMAKDRENHNVVSRDLVLQMAEDGVLPMDSAEAEIVASLCKWHRGEYDPKVTAACGVRTGLLAAILRLADAMDLDYRRSDDYQNRQPVIDAIYPGQRQHHVSVRNVLALRLLINRLGIRIELFVDHFEEANLQLTRLVAELVGTPFGWPVQVCPTHGVLEQPSLPAVHSNRKAVIFAYCNPHGVVQAAISKRQLNQLGFDTEVICDYARTGQPEDFWQKTVPDWDFSNTDLVVVLDLDLTPPLFDKIMEVFHTNSRCRWIYGSPLDRSSAELSALVEAGVDVLVADDRVLFAGHSLDPAFHFWIKVAGLCNFDDPLTSTAGVGREEFEAARGLRHYMWKLWESKAPPRDYAELINRMLSDDAAFFIEQATAWTQVLEDKYSKPIRVGKVLHCGTLPLSGRFSYDLAYLAIEREGLISYEHNEFQTPYVICTWPSSRGSAVLYVSRFQNPENAYPVKYFVTPNRGQIGSCSTIWQTFPDEGSANAAIESTTKRINSFFTAAEDGASFSPA